MHTLSKRLLAALILFLIPTLATAEVPRRLLVQGALGPDARDTGGGKTTQADLLFVLTDPTGGDVLYEELRCGVSAVGRDGRFQVVLGASDPAGNPVAPEIFSMDPIWLSTSRCTNRAACAGTPDASLCDGIEISRSPLEPVGYAMRSATAEATDDADRLDGLDSSDFWQKSDSYGGDVAGTGDDLQIVAGAVGAAEIADGSVGEGKLSFDPATQAELDQLAGLIASLMGDVEDLQDQVDVLEESNDALQDLLVHFSRQDDDVFITGANLHIVNGTGSTDDSNGLGNLVVGYNEDRTGGNTRTGSHFLVLGMQNDYSGAGGLVAGVKNSVEADFASVLGGTSNRVLAVRGTISGGSNNEVTGNAGSILGGSSNHVKATNATISGGDGNHANAAGSTVSGGRLNAANGAFSAVSGGYKRWVRFTNNWRGGDEFSSR